MINGGRGCNGDGTNVTHVGPVEEILRKASQETRETRIREVHATVQQRNEEESRVHYETTQTSPTNLILS